MGHVPQIPGSAWPPQCLQGPEHLQEPLGHVSYTPHEYSALASSLNSFKRWTQNIQLSDSSQAQIWTNPGVSLGLCLCNIEGMGCVSVCPCAVEEGAAGRCLAGAAVKVLPSFARSLAYNENLHCEFWGVCFSSSAAWTAEHKILTLTYLELIPFSSALNILQSQQVFGLILLNMENMWVLNLLCWHLAFLNKNL